MKIETHLHIKGASGDKCAKMSPEEIIEVYSKNNYGAIFVTNHLSDKNYKLNELQRIIDVFEYTKMLGDKVNLKVFFGVELNHCHNDYLIYGLTTEIIKNNNLSIISFEDLKKFCNRYNAIVVHAHPFREKHGKFCYKVNSDVDGIEVINGHPNHNQHNDMSLDYATKNNKIMTAGSDCHKPLGACRAAMVFDNDILSELHFINMVKLGKYKVEKYF